jgi:hypothetical protein
VILIVLHTIYISHNSTNRKNICLHKESEIGRSQKKEYPGKANPTLSTPFLQSA